YVGKQICESGFSEKDFNVLTLYRGSTVVPNPKASRVLEAGDRILCFGKLETMRELVPVKIRKKRENEVQDLPDLPVSHQVLETP
ncbi:30S ribosomal protein S6--L-glutamate ligase, partial [Mariniblastus sp.]|nr:30S ribosomal protein S6--L-glutamate ligase [Mariniblastus sp.]